MNSKITGKILTTLFVIMIIWSTIAIASHNNNGNKDEFAQRGVINLSDGWVYNFNNGVSGITQLPATLPKNDSKELLLTNVLPTISEPTSLFYKVRHVPVKILVGGEVRVDRISGRDFTHFDNDMDGLFYQEVKLNPEDSGKTIVIYSYGNSKKYLVSPGKVLIGDRGSVILSIINSRWKNLLFIGLLGSLAFFLLLIWLIILVIGKIHSKELLCLSVYSWLVTLWLVTESEVYQFMLRDTGKITILAYELLMFMSMPMAMFFYNYSERIHAKRFTKILAALSVVVFTINNVLHNLNLVHLTDTLIVSQCLLGFETICIAIIQINEIRYKLKTKNQHDSVSWKIPLFGIACLAPMASIEIVKYAFFSSRSIGDGIMISIGVLIYIFTLAADCCVKFLYQNQSQALDADVKSRQLSNIGNAIITPANAIMTLNNVTLMNTKDPDIVEIAMDISNACQKLKSVIDATFDEDVLNANIYNTTVDEFRTLNLIQRLYMMFAQMAVQQGLTLDLEVDPVLPNIIIGDSKAITQALLIMMNNAIRYTDQGVITFRVKAERMDPDKGYCNIKFAIKDAGKGISQEDQKLILDAYNSAWHIYAEPNKHIAESDRTLSRILNALNSRMEIDSKPGEGAECSFTTCMGYIDDDTVGEVNIDRQQLDEMLTSAFTFSAQNTKILLADDDPVVRDAFKSLLALIGIQTDTVKNGYEAVEKAKSKSYDIILLAQTMPKMDGLAASRIIRGWAKERKDAYFANVPILALVPNSVLGMNDKYVISGINDIFYKPMEMNMLNDLLLKWLPKEKVTLKNIANEQRNSEIDPRWSSVPDCVNVEAAMSVCFSYDMFLEACRTFVRKTKVGILKIQEFQRREDIENLVIGISILEKGAMFAGLTEICRLYDEICELNDAKEYKKLLEKTSEILYYTKLCTEDLSKVISQ